jgi:hypothetical protein
VSEACEPAQAAAAEKPKGGKRCFASKMAAAQQAKPMQAELAGEGTQGALTGRILAQVDHVPSAMEATADPD